MKLEELTEIMCNDDKIDKKDIIKILSEECGKCKNEVFKCLYKKFYGDTLIPQVCEKFIATFKNQDSSGAIWTLEETNNVAKKLDIDFKSYSPEEFRTMMNMEYYEHSIPLKKSSITLDSSDWGRIADYSLKDDPSKLVRCFFHKLEM